MIAAMIAGVGSTARHAVVFPLDLTLRAGGNAVRPALFLQKLKAGIAVWKLGIELSQRVLLRFVQAIVATLNVAHKEIMPSFSRYLACEKGANLTAAIRQAMSENRPVPRPS